MSKAVFELGRPLASLLEPIIGRGKVHAVRASQNTALPYLVYRRVRLDESLRADKCDADGAGVAVEMDIYTATYPEGLRLAAEVYEALDACNYVSEADPTPFYSTELLSTEEGVTEDGAIFVQSLDYALTL